MNLLPGKTTAFYKWGGDRTVGSYFNLYFETYTPNYLLQILLGHTVYRNTSIFPESPMFAYVLCLALAKEVLGKLNAVYLASQSLLLLYLLRVQQLVLM